jgi:hypothetical protein
VGGDQSIPFPRPRGNGPIRLEGKTCRKDDRKSDGSIRINTVVAWLELSSVVGCSGGVRFDAETLMIWIGYLVAKFIDHPTNQQNGNETTSSASGMSARPCELDYVRRM